VSRRTARPRSTDELLIRRAAFRVGLWITVAVAGLVVLVLLAVFGFILSQISFAELVRAGRGEEGIDVGGLDVLLAGVLLGLAAIALAGTLGWFATRRAVAPLVDALGRQRRFVADASHELRTPLAILDTRLQVLERKLEKDSPHADTVRELRADSRNLIVVIDDLLDSVDTTLARHRETASVDKVAGEAIAAMRMLAADRNIDLTLASSSPAVQVPMSAASLQRVLVALIDNAVKHSPDHASIRLTVRSVRSEVEITVSDQGRGIRGVDPARVFDRFTRTSDAVDGGGNSRIGFGIGLSLVREAVVAAGGDVRVAATTESGTTIAIRLPVASRKTRRAAQRNRPVNS